MSWPTSSNRAEPEPPRACRGHPRRATAAKLAPSSPPHPASSVRPRPLGAESSSPVDALLPEIAAGTLDLSDRAKWATLAANSKSLAGHDAELTQYFTDLIDAGLITFETITEDQRKIFNLINATDREKLRRIAIQKSKLFEVLTEMQLVEKDAAERAKVAAERMNTTKDGDYYVNSLAEEFAAYTILPEMLTAEVPGSPISGNEPLAAYVRQLRQTYPADPGKITADLVAKTWWMACGLGNLFALAASRGFAEPTSAGAKKWLKEVVLDKPPGQALVQVSQGKFDIKTSQVLTDLSKTGKQPKYSAQTVPLTKPDSAALFQKAMVASAGKLDTRIGMAQGKGKSGHMYIVYKDMDGVWRTMDMYMSIADRPGGGLPYNETYATEKSWHKLVID